MATIDTSSSQWSKYSFVFQINFFYLSGEYTQASLSFSLWGPVSCHHYSALLVARHQAYEKERKAQRIEQMQQEVRNTVLTLHEQGIHSSYDRARALLLKPYIMSRPEANEAWRVTCKELGRLDASKSEDKFCIQCKTYLPFT